MTDVLLPGTKTLENPVGKNIGNVLSSLKAERTTPGDGANQIPNYRIYPCISRPFFTSKSVQKIVLDLYMGQNFRPKHQLNIFCTISITIVFICYQTSCKQQYSCVVKLAVQVGIPYDLSA